MPDTKYFSNIQSKSTGDVYVVKDKDARDQIANKADNEPTFTEASTRANIASGETMPTMLGKIKKFFTDLKTVAFSGSYTDLSDKPTIPAAANNGTLTIQKNGTNVQTFTANQSTNATANITVPTALSDLTDDATHRVVTDTEKSTWNGKATTTDITNAINALDVSSVGGSGKYISAISEADGKISATATDFPTIPAAANNGTLTIQKNGTNVQTFTANQSTNATANITVPTKTSELTNDSGYITGSYLPLSGGNMTGNISYTGSKATYTMIKFINNTDNVYGNGIGIGGGGQVIIGGGESSDVMIGQTGTTGEEIMWIGNDGDVNIYTNLQNGWDSRKSFVFNTGGNLTVPGSITENGTALSSKYAANSDATTSASGLMSASDKTKLNGIATGAEVNQNAFSNVVVGSTTIAADGKTDTLTLTAGSNITLTPDATNDKVTIAATDTTYSSKSAASGGTDVSLVTTGEKYTWNSKADVANAATTGAVGLVNASDGSIHYFSGTSGSSLYVYPYGSNNYPVIRAQASSSTYSNFGTTGFYHTDSNKSIDVAATSGIVGSGNGSDNFNLTRQKLSYLDNITSDVQAQINGKAASSHTHNYAGSSSAGGSATSAVYANTINATYSGNGGQQNPSYFGKNRLGSLMSNQTINGDSAYKNWIYMDGYNGSDVGGASAIGVDRYYGSNTTPRAFIMTSDANRTSWNASAELITTSNVSSYASGTKLYKHILKLDSDDVYGMHLTITGMRSTYLGYPIHSSNTYNIGSFDTYDITEGITLICSTSTLLNDTSKISQIISNDNHVRCENNGGSNLRIRFRNSHISSGNLVLYGSILSGNTGGYYFAGADVYVYIRSTAYFVDTVTAI